MSITEQSAARRAGFKIDNDAVDKSAAIDMAKIGTRTLRRGLPAQAFYGSGTSVAISADEVFPVWTLPNANTGSLFTSFPMPAEWVSGQDLTLKIYFKTTVISGDVKFTVDLASKTVNESTALSNTQTVVKTVPATASELEVAEVTFSASLFAAGDIVAIKITRDPSDGSDTAAGDIKFVAGEVTFTGRG